MGCLVTSAANVVTALRLVAPPRPGLDVVLTDYWLPDGTGADLARAIDGRLPVVLFAGDLDEVPPVDRDVFLACFSKLEPFDVVGARLIECGQARPR